jgi:hypothetical protein
MNLLSVLRLFKKRHCPYEAEAESDALREEHARQIREAVEKAKAHSEKLRIVEEEEERIRWLDKEVQLILREDRRR